MKRMKVLFGQRRLQVLLTLAVLLLAVSVVIGSGANFTATSANAGNAFTAGNLTMSNDLSGDPIVQFVTTKMRPGDSVNGTVTLSNTGDVPGAFSLTKSAVTGIPGLAARLDLVIQEVNGLGVDVGSATFTGKLNGTISNQSLGIWQAAATHHYKFTVTWPNTPRNDDADNLLKAATCSVGFTWDAESTIN